jgi:hypothetical protein
MHELQTQIEGYIKGQIEAFNNAYPKDREERYDDEDREQNLRFLAALTLKATRKYVSPEDPEIKAQRIAKGKIVFDDPSDPEILWKSLTWAISTKINIRNSMLLSPLAWCFVQMLYNGISSQDRRFFKNRKQQYAEVVIDAVIELAKEQLIKAGEHDTFLEITERDQECWLISKDNGEKYKIKISGFDDDGNAALQPLAYNDWSKVEQILDTHNLKIYKIPPKQLFKMIIS